nr:hypothetical protein [Rhodovulum sp. PH10]
MAPPLGEQAAEAVGVVGLVRDEAGDRPDPGDQRRRERDVVDVAGREQQNERPTAVIGQGVDFRRPPAARAADRLLEGPPFPPAAER